MQTNIPFILGLTGGIGSGKSTVRRIFESFGIPCYDADTRAKWLMTNDLSLISDIKQLLGCEAYTLDGQLNKPFVAGKIFNNKTLLNEINSIVHPAVARDFAAFISEQHSDYVVKEAAILFESGSYKETDAVVLVTAPEHIRIARVCARDNVTYEDVKARIANQMSDDEKRKLAQYVIDNDGINAILPQVTAIHKQLKRH